MSTPPLLKKNVFYIIVLGTQRIMEEQTERVLKTAIKALEEADPVEASKVLSPLFEYEFDCPPLIFTSSCCNFWIRRQQKANGAADSFERGELLMSYWKEFMQDFVANRARVQYPPTISAARRGVFSAALKDYEEVTPKSHLVYRRMAMCCKKLGFYDKSLAHLTSARKNAGADTGASEAAEMADCYALCGDDRNAKLLFREAFFIAPDEIDLDMLDSDLIRVLISKTQDKGYTGQLLSRWVAVWGTLWGVFCVKRGIKSVEAAKLRQEIFSLENEIGSTAKEKDVIVPRLLNLYFWYIDYLTQARSKEENAAKLIDDVLLKIKILDKKVYEVYVR